MSKKFFVKHHRGLTKRLKEAGVNDGPPVQVLMELLTFWNQGDKNYEIFPAIATIQEITGYSERTVQRGLKAIESSGLLVKVPSPRGVRTTTWMVTNRLKEVLDGSLCE